MKIIKFSQNSCPKCEILSNLLEGADLIPDESINLDEIEESLKSHYKEKYFIMGVPLMIVVDEDGNELNRTSSFNKFGEINDFFESVE